MLRDLLSSRWFQGGFAFFVLCVGGSLFYSWHVRWTTEAELGKRPQPVVSIENKSSTNTAPVDFQTEGITNTPKETMNTPMSESTEAETRDETEFADIVDAFLPDDFVSAEAPAEEVAVSPFGFGPYPEVPTGYPTHLQPVWLWSEERQQRHTSSRLESFELIDRVLIELWNQGNRNFTGAIREDTNGKVYPLYKDIIYVTWAELKDDNGKIIGTYARNQLSSDKTQRISFRDYMEGRIPPNIQFMDRETSGIDPYMFLGLRRR